MRIIPLNKEQDSSSAFSFFRVDVACFVLGVLLLALGSFLLFTNVYGSNQFNSLWTKHWVGFGCGAILAFFLFLMSDLTLQEISPILYGFAIALLVLVLFAGAVVHGSKSWLALGSFRFQPAELAKLAAIVFVSRRAAHFLGVSPFLSGLQKLELFIWCAVPMFLVLLQNDFSSSLAFGFIILAYSVTLEIFSPPTLMAILLYGALVYGLTLLDIIAGLKLPAIVGMSQRLQTLGFGPGAVWSKWLFWLFACLAASYLIYGLLKSLFILPRNTRSRWFIFLALILFSSHVVSWMGFRTLKNYQKARIVSFLLPKADPLGSGYHITQSKIAIGSGGVLGRGVLLGSQTALGFLPERHTDFAFAALAEEAGFLGSALVLVLFSLFFWRIYKVIHLSRDLFGKLVAVGFLTMWAGELCLNLACVLGMMPILGVGLPFISYGGSRLIMNMAGLGVLLSLSRRFYVYS